jgi:hypothetical protein
MHIEETADASNPQYALDALLDYAPAHRNILVDGRRKAFSSIMRAS